MYDERVREMTDNEMSMQDKTMQGFNNALENLPLLISVLKGKTSLLLRHKLLNLSDLLHPKIIKAPLILAGLFSIGKKNFQLFNFSTSAKYFLVKCGVFCGSVKEPNGRALTAMSGGA